MAFEGRPFLVRHEDQLRHGLPAFTDGKEEAPVTSRGNRGKSSGCPNQPRVLRLR